MGEIKQLLVEHYLKAQPQEGEDMKNDGGGGSKDNEQGGKDDDVGDTAAMKRNPGGMPPNCHHGLKLVMS